MPALLVGAALLVVLERTLSLAAGATGPAPLWVCLLALGVGYGACLLVAGGLDMGLRVFGLGRARDK